jgi:hypothetical protein
MGNANRHELYEMICQGSNIIAIRKKNEKNISGLPNLRMRMQNTPALIMAW